MLALLYGFEACEKKKDKNEMNETEDLRESVKKDI